MITLLLLLAQDNRVVYTDRTPTREILAVVRPAVKPPSPELLAKLKEREYKRYGWPDGPLVASTDWKPWLDRPGAMYDRWRDPERVAWRAAGPSVVYAPMISTPVIHVRKR